MKIEGVYSFNASRQRVWDTMLDPDAIRGCIPGCQEFAATDDDSYDVSLKVGIGAVTGSYRAKVAISDKMEPESYTISVEGKGRGTSFRGSGRVVLAETPEGCEARFAGDARVTGLIARVGQRLMGSASSALAGQFFACVKEKVEAREGG